MKNIWPKIILILSTLLFSGCATVNVQPWQKGFLAKKEMLINPDPLDAAIRGHVFASKEAAAESANVGAGGCGCN